MTPRTTTIDRTTVLPTPPSMAFAVVCSPETAALIDPAVREWRPSERPIRVGTRFAIRGRLGRLPIRGTSEVITWDPPQVAEFRSVAPTWPLRMTARHRFEETPGGATAYTWSISFQEMNVVARPVIALAARLFAKALEAQGEALRSYLDDLPPDAPLPRL